ncbi:hypothetical protein ODJ79_12665 [Actinoplanes sp. KI2]|uniref:hypothetical protein n=1 Tax=Actinoplanes sp. KI2 TaxID=2983315 RepID=UPI0021D6067D|nr:hypothetical protein [Actinoplanes sp. KI2]MCU7724572.1 hypothetical protein [Actinoplanes sp. KI2]
MTTALTDNLLPDEIADAITGQLAALGETTDAIADRLAALGITGHRTESDRCPIARYLFRLDPSLYAVNVLGDVIEVCTGTGAEITVPTPNRISAFVACFDIGRYPRLDASEQPNPLANPGTTIRKEDRP